MDSPGDSTEWPSDLAAQVAELNNESEQQSSHTFTENTNLQGLPAATLTESQIQMLTQAGYNFSFFQLPPTHTVQTTDPTIDNSSDINTLTEAFQQQIQALPKDSGWPANQAKIGTSTPSTVILNIDGTPQEIPISFHIDTCSTLPGAANSLSNGAENNTETLVDLNRSFELDPVPDEIKAVQTSTNHQQIIQHIPVPTPLTGIASPVKLFTVPARASSFVNTSVVPVTFNTAVPVAVESDPSKSKGINENETSVVNIEPIQEEIDSIEPSETVVNDSDKTCNTLATEVRKSSRIARQSIPIVAAPRPKYDPESEYSTSKMWCEECQTSYDDECPNHTLQPIYDKVVLSRAWSSLPPVLQIFRIGDTPNLGVFSKKFIQKRIKFGPFIAEAEKVKPNPENCKLHLELDISNGETLYLDATDEDKCNWMMFVRPAENYAEQNLVVFQFQEDLYFVSIKDIHPKDELKVWYAPHYAKKLGKQVHLRNIDHQDENRGRFECYECNKKLKSAALLQKHLTDSHECSGNADVTDDNDNISIDPLVEITTIKSEKEIKNSGASFQSWKKKKRNLYFNKIKKYRELKTRAEAKRKEYSQTWKCDHCILTFDSATLLNIHNLTHAAEATIIEEHLENEALAQLSAAAAQITSEAENRRTLAQSGVDSTGEIRCPCCNVAFSNTSDLIQHTAVHAKTRRPRRSRRDRIFNPKKPYMCNLCIKTFSTDERLQRHKLVHSKDDSHKLLECSECHKKFMNNPALACHMKTHSNEKYYSCPICREGFDQMHMLKVHGQTHAVNGVYPCPHCHKTFYDFNSVRKHMRQYHPYKELPCPHCDKVFPRTDKLKLHMLKHSNHKEYMCDQCGRQFKRKDKLKEHTKRMHDPKNPKTLRQYVPGTTPKEKFIPKVQPTDYNRFIYKCHACLLGFKRRGMLVNHLAKRHPDMKPESVPELNLPILRTQRDFFCQYCDKVYKSSSKRKAHIMKSHPGAELPPGGRIRTKEYEGDLNNYGINTATYSQLTGSVAANPHPCEYCHKQYASKPKLLQHQRREHPNYVPPKKPNVRNFTLRDKYGAMSVDKLEIPDASATVVIQQDGQTADLLTQAMSELTQSFSTEYRPSPQQQPGHQVTQEYQLNLANVQSNRPSSNVVLQPAALLQPGAVSLDLTSFIQDVHDQEDDNSHAVAANQTQTITVPLSLATQLMISRSFIQSTSGAK